MDDEGEKTPVDREAAVDALLDFQRAHLAELLQERERIANDIAAATARAASGADRLSAARALVAARSAGASLSASAPQHLPADYAGSGTNPSEVAGPVEGCSMNEVVSGAAPVGVLYSGFRRRFEAPRQSFTGATGDATVVCPAYPPPGLDGLQPGQRLVLTYWLDRNAGHWREFVRPPRRARGAGRVGVFATRSPNRPTPVGLSMCVLRSIEQSGRLLQVTGVDVLDETPLLSVRPYTTHDSFPDAKHGWLEDEEVTRPLYYDAGSTEFEVKLAESVLPKIEFIDQRSVVDVLGMVRKSLARRGAKKEGVMAVGAFRVLYEQEGNMVTVFDVVSGMRASVVEEEAFVDPEMLLHTLFKQKFDDVQ